MLRAHRLLVQGTLAGRMANATVAAGPCGLAAHSGMRRSHSGCSVALPPRRPLQQQQQQQQRTGTDTPVPHAVWHRTLAVGATRGSGGYSAKATAGDAPPLPQQSQLPSAPSPQQQHSRSEPLLPSLRRWWLQRSRRHLPLSAPLPCTAAAAAGASTAAEAASSSTGAAGGSGAVAPAADGVLDVQSAVAQQLSEQLAAAGGGDAVSNAIAAAASRPTHPLLQAAMDSIVWVHEVSGTPWWASLILCGLAARIALLPVQLYSGRVAAGMAGLEPHFIQLDVLARGSPHPPATRFMVVAKLKWALYNKYRCNPLLLVPGGVLQMSTFILMAMSLRRLITSNPDLALGGAMWFPNLAVPDPTYALPVATWVAGYAVSTYIGWQREREGAVMREKAVASVVAKKHAKESQAQANAGTLAAIANMHKGEGPPPAEAVAAAAAAAAAASATPPKRDPTHLELLGHYGRGLQILMITILPQLPAGLMFFWLTSISWQLGTHVLLRMPSVRERLGYTAAEEVLRNKTAEMALERNRNAEKQIEAATKAQQQQQQQLKRIGQQQHTGPAAPYVHQPGTLRRVSSLPASNPTPPVAPSSDQQQQPPLSKRKQQQLARAQAKQRSSR